VAIYSDSLDSNWWEGSWDTTVNFANADPVKSGTSSVAITHNGGYAGFNLGVNSALPLGPGDKLRFWVHGGAAGGQTLWVKVNGNETNVFSVPAPAANSWAQVEVPFSFFGGPTSLNGMYIQNGTGDAQSTYYVDDLIVVQASCS
jgi:endoglucanase